MIASGIYIRSANDEHQYIRYSAVLEHKDNEISHIHAQLFLDAIDSTGLQYHDGETPSDNATCGTVRTEYDVRHVAKLNVSLKALQIMFANLRKEDDDDVMVDMMMMMMMISKHKMKMISLIPRP
jgi:hypothetical protein